MKYNMLTFDLVIAVLTFTVFRKLILHMNIGWETGVLFNFIVYINAPYNFYSVMLNKNLIFRQMFLEYTKCTF